MSDIEGLLKRADELLSEGSYTAWGADDVEESFDLIRDLANHIKSDGLTEPRLSVNSELFLHHGRSAIDYNKDSSGMQVSSPPIYNRERDMVEVVINQSDDCFNRARKMFKIIGLAAPDGLSCKLAEVIAEYMKLDGVSHENPSL